MILDCQEFPQADARLRQGHHISATHDPDLYGFIADQHDELVALYRRYGCVLEHCQGPGTQGAYYLASDGQALLPSRVLPESCTHLALVLLKENRLPSYVQEETAITLEGLLGFIASTLTPETQKRIYAPKRRRDGIRLEERIHDEVVRALKTLRKLKCIDWDAPHGPITIRDGLYRFSDLLRAEHPDNPLVRARLTAHGVVFPEDLQDREDGETGTDAGEDTATERDEAEEDEDLGADDPRMEDSTDERGASPFPADPTDSTDPAAREDAS